MDDISDESGLLPVTRQCRECAVKHLVRAQLGRQDALPYEPFDEGMDHAYEHVGRHRQLVLVERAQPLGAELIALPGDLEHARTKVRRLERVSESGQSSYRR